MSQRQARISTTDQREEGFKDEMKAFPNIQVWTPVQRRRRQQGGDAAAVVFARNPTSTACSAPTCSRPSAPPTACSRPASRARSRSSPSTRRLDRRQLKTGLVDIASPASGEIGYTASSRPMPTHRPVDPVLIGTGFTVMDKSNIDKPEVAQFIYKD